MSKRLKLFGLLALVLALGAGVAWGAAEWKSRTLAGTDSNPFELGKQIPAGVVANVFNLITGNGSQVGSVTTNNDAAYTNLVLKVSAAKDNVIEVAPRAGTAARPVDNLWQSVAGRPLQLVVNADNNMGKVVVKASNGDDPRVNADLPAGVLAPAGGSQAYTFYTGGTVQENGILGVTHDNSLGQNWVGVRAHRDMAKAPVFQVEKVDKVTIGAPDPDPATDEVQPFYLMYDPATAVAGYNPANEVTYVKIMADALSAKTQGLWLRHGLDQRIYTAPTAGLTAVAPAVGNPDTLATVAEASLTGFVRLIKQGKGLLHINSDSTGLAANGADLRKVDGAHHRGGTLVESGTVQVDGGNAKIPADHFRGSLGKIWTAFQGSGSTMADPYDPVSYLAASVGNTYLPGTGGMPALYNPLWVQNDAKVMVNRSQFFSDFNIAKAATFHVDEYTLKGTNYNPQVTVTLDGNDSLADGLLEGKFDLVLASNAAAARPANTHPQSGAINSPAQAIFFINKPENKIFAEGETLVANGVLEIAGNKSIGGGQVTIGATGSVGTPDRGFLTPAPAVGLGTFAASKTFNLENVTVGQDRGAVAVERGETLSFKDITLNNTGIGGANSFRINPADVALGAGYNNIGLGDPFVTTPSGGLLPGNWTDTATVEFGAASSADAKYSVAGVLRNPTRVDVERGVWHLNSFLSPTADQAAAGDTPFMHVYVWPTAVLSLAKDVNDFSPYMDLKVTDDSRIRVVLRDSDIATTRADAMGKDPVFQAHHIDYSGLGSGAQNKDRRLAIQLDPTQLTDKALKKGWVKLVFSPDARNWNHLHYLREYTPNLTYEDYAKVRITWTTKSDIVKNAVAHVDQNSYTILLEVGTDVTDPVNPGTPTPTPDEKPDGPEISAPATVEPGKPVTFMLGDWYNNKKKLAAGDIKDIVWMLDGKDVTAQVKGNNKLEVNAPAAEGTMTLEIKGKLVSDPTKELSQKKSVTVKKAGTTPTPTPDSGKSSGGGCDAGFGGLALVLAAAFLLKKKA